MKIVAYGFMGGVEYAYVRTPYFMKLNLLTITFIVLLHFREGLGIRGYRYEKNCDLNRWW